MGLILREDCKLVIINDKPFIKMKEHNIPISRKGAVFVSLLDGERSIEEVKDILFKINLNTMENQEFFIENVFRQYGHFIIDSEDIETNYNRGYSPKEFLLTKNHSREEFYNTTVPRCILFHVTEKCDKECRYCYLDAKKGALELDALETKEVMKIIDEAAEIGIYSISYMGGEPFLRKDLVDIIAYASSKGIYNQVVTKFYLNEEQIMKLRECNINISLSYDCHVDELASYLVGRKNHGEKMDNVIRLFVKYGISFSVNPVITGITAKYFGEFLTHLSKMGVKKVNIAKYSPSLGRNDEELLVTDEQWSEIGKITETFKDFKVGFLNYKCKEMWDSIDEFKEKSVGVCLNGRSAISILPNGKVVMCEVIPNKMDFCFGDLKKSSIMEIWNSEKREKLLSPSRDLYKGTSCNICNDFHKCSKKLACLLKSISESGTAYIPSEEVRNSCKLYLANAELIK